MPRLLAVFALAVLLFAQTSTAPRDYVCPMDPEVRSAARTNARAVA
jgi:hypothetical protein